MHDIVCDEFYACNNSACHAHFTVQTTTPARYSIPRYKTVRPTVDEWHWCRV